MAWGFLYAGTHHTFHPEAPAGQTRLKHSPYSNNENQYHVSARVFTLCAFMWYTWKISGKKDL